MKGWAAALRELCLRVCGVVGADRLTLLGESPDGNLNDDILLLPSSSSTSIEPTDERRCLFSRPCMALAGDSNTGGCGSGRGEGGGNASLGAAGGGWKVNPPGLNSIAAAFSGFPNDGVRACPNTSALGAGGGGDDVAAGAPGAQEPDCGLAAPNTNGFAKGFKEGPLLPVSDGLVT